MIDATTVYYLYIRFSYFLFLLAKSKEKEGK